MKIPSKDSWKLTPILPPKPTDDPEALALWERLQENAKEMVEAFDSWKHPYLSYRPVKSDDFKFDDITASMASYFKEISKDTFTIDSLITLPKKPGKITFMESLKARPVNDLEKMAYLNVHLFGEAGTYLDIDEAIGMGLIESEYPRREMVRWLTARTNQMKGIRNINSRKTKRKMRCHKR